MVNVWLEELQRNSKQHYYMDAAGLATLTVGRCEEISWRYDSEWAGINDKSNIMLKFA
jgi:hypothetical protein